MIQLTDKFVNDSQFQYMCIELGNQLIMAI
jgi:hypothetical protein